MARRLAVCLPLLLLSGCYLLNQAQGQLRILSGRVEIGKVLADPAVPDETKAKLRLIREIKEFGEREMGLKPSSSYSHFYDTAGAPVSYVVSACRKDRFEPHVWWFPIVGTVPYKGFFRKEDALAEARALEGQGYDVSVGPVAAYSTLGWFADPVLSTMLEYSEADLAALILHELTHGTVWLPGGTDFNESLASFVGQQGALEFVRRRHGISSPEYRRAVLAFAREEKRDGRVRKLFDQLNALYRSGASREEKLKRREEIAGEMAREERRLGEERQRELRELAARGATEFELEEAREGEAVVFVARLPVNNAEILMQRRYGRYDVFRALFERVGGEWPRFFAELPKSAQ